MTSTERIHGSLQAEEAARFGRARNEFLDFSANLNPYGPPASALAAAAGSDLSRYPDPACTEVRHVLAKKLSVDADEVLVGNGSSELFHLVARAYLGPGGRAVIFEPGFGEYGVAVKAAGARAIEVTANVATGFTWDIDAALKVIEEQRPALALLGMPNNPTGVYLDEASVRRLAVAMAPGVLVLDEAYVSFVEAPWRSLRIAPNVVVVRSLTKDFALPGLRLGYLVAAKEMAERIGEQQPSWSVSAPAQDAAIACLAEDAWLEETIARTREAKAGLVKALGQAGFDVWPGAANFVLVQVGDAAATRLKLLERGIAVRDCASFDLPSHIRVGVRRPTECVQLVEALKQVMR